jgi:hypothetical protein
MCLDRTVRVPSLEERMDDHRAVMGPVRRWVSIPEAPSSASASPICITRSGRAEHVRLVTVSSEQQRRKRHSTRF